MKWIAISCGVCIVVLAITLIIRNHVSYVWDFSSDRDADKVFQREPGIVKAISPKGATTTLKLDGYAFQYAVDEVTFSRSGGKVDSVHLITFLEDKDATKAMAETVAAQIAIPVPKLDEWYASTDPEARFIGAVLDQNPTRSIEIVPRVSGAGKFTCVVEIFWRS